MEKWGHLDEIWVKPQQYALEPSLVTGAMVLVIALAFVSTARRIVDRDAPISVRAATKDARAASGFHRPARSRASSLPLLSYLP